ncbi:Zinc finger, CCHC-type [Phytophthora cactorum]|nr:Zinc finger, CCHC-type [Phytophthora cactorum]
MVFGNEYEDEGDKRNFGRAEKRDDGEQHVSVPADVERLERVARVRVSRDPLSVVEQAPVSDEGAAESQGVATTGINLESDVWRELFADEAKETEEEEKGRSATGVTVKTEVKEEPEVKREVVWGPHATDGYDSEYYDAHEAYDSAYEAEYEEDDVVTSERSPSGFISRYTGPEVQRSDRPAFGWSWGAQREEGSYATEAGQSLCPSSVSFAAVTSAASTAPGRPALKVSSTLATGASAVTQGGSSMSRRATAAPVGSCQSVASPRRVVKSADPFHLAVDYFVEPAWRATSREQSSTRYLDGRLQPYPGTVYQCVVGTYARAQQSYLQASDDEGRSCGVVGHVFSECESPQRPFHSRTSTGCFFCHDPSHVVAGCPVIGTLRSLIPQASNAAQPTSQPSLDNEWGRRRSHSFLWSRYWLK